MCNSICNSICNSVTVKIENVHHVYIYKKECTINVQRLYNDLYRQCTSIKMYFKKIL